MKIYLAGPMTGIPHFNFPLFMKVAQLYREAGHEVFNPAERDNSVHGTDISKDNITGDPKLATKQHGFSLNDALADDLWYICKTADTIVLLPGWENSKGAQAEHATARALGLRFIYLRENEIDA
jgi:hypothetical protein